MALPLSSGEGPRGPRRGRLQSLHVEPLQALADGSAAVAGLNVTRCLREPPPPEVRKTPSWPRSWANFKPFTAAFPQECVGQPASFGPT
jgi:hypothetical protein